MNQIVNDTSFVPADPAATRVLTGQQIADYNRDGYINGIDVFDASEMTGIRSTVDRLMQSAGRDGAYSINCYQARAKSIWDLCTAPAILDQVQDIIGPDIICWASHFFCKMPGDPKHVPWHQDASFWHLSPTRTVTVWLAIDDADEENATMQFIPGTHRMGQLDWKTAEGDAVLNKQLEGVDALGAPVFNTLRAGQISLHADMLAHSSTANRSDRRRCGLTIRYCPPQSRIINDDWKQGVEAIICRGSDESGHWVHHPRPDADDVSPENSPRNVGGN